MQTLGVLILYFSAGMFNTIIKNKQAINGYFFIRSFTNIRKLLGTKTSSPF